MKDRIALHNASALLLVVPIVIGLGSGENWQMRALAILLFLAAFVATFAPMLASRNFSFMLVEFASRRARLARVVGEVVCRLCFLGLTIYILLLFCRVASDLFHIARTGAPVAVEATIKHEYSDSLTWWAWKGVDVTMPDGTSMHYELFFHPRTAQAGRRYRVVILPNARCVLALLPPTN